MAAITGGAGGPARGLPAPQGYPTLGSITTAPAAHPTVVAPVISLAQQLAQYAQLPQIQAIHQAQAQADAAAKAQQQTIAGYYAALAPLLAHIAPAVQQSYQQAAGMDALLGKGFGNELQSQQNANANQAGGILGLAGAPQGQTDAVNRAIGGPGVANALGWLNGGLPAAGLNQAGAAAGAAARSLPGSVSEQGAQLLSSLTGKQQLADAGFGQKLTDLAAQYPGLLLKTQNQLQNQQVQQASAASLARSRDAAVTGIDPLTGQPTLAAKQAQALVDYRDTMATIAKQRADASAKYEAGLLSQHDYTNQLKAQADAATAAYHRAEAALSAQRNATTARNDAARNAISAKNAATSRIKAEAAAKPHFSSSTSRALGYRADQYGNPLGKNPQLLPGFGFDASGNIVKRSASASSRQHGLTTVEVNKARGTALTLAQNAFQGFTDSKGVAHPALTYQQAVLEAQKEGLPKWIYVPAFNRFYTAADSGNPYAVMGPPEPASIAKANQ